MIIHWDVWITLAIVIQAAWGITAEARGDRGGGVVLILPALIVCFLMAFLAHHAGA